MLDVANTFGNFDLQMYNKIADRLNESDASIGRADSELKTKILYHYADPIIAISHAKELIKDKIRYDIAGANTHLALTPVGFIHSQEAKWEKEDYRQAFLTGRLPLHGLGDPPGDTIAGDMAKLGKIPPGMPGSNAGNPVNLGNVPPVSAPILYSGGPAVRTNATTLPPLPTAPPLSPPPVGVGCDEPIWQTHHDKDGGVIGNPHTPSYPYKTFFDVNGIWGPPREFWYIPADWILDGKGDPAPPDKCKPGTGNQPGPPTPKPPPGDEPPPEDGGGDGPEPPIGTSPTPPPAGPPAGGSPTPPPGGTTPPGGSPPILTPGPVTPITPSPTPYPEPPPLLPIEPGPPSTPTPPGPPPMGGGGGGGSPTPTPVTPTPTPDPPFPPPWSPSPTPAPPTPIPTPEPPFPPPWSPTPTPEPEPEPPPGGGSSPEPKHCSGDDRWDPCWREIGGKQGSDREIYVSPGWVGRVSEARGQYESLGNTDPDPSQPQISVSGGVELPGVCDTNYQYNLIGNGELFAELDKNIDKIGKQAWESMYKADTAASVASALVLGPITHVMSIAAKYLNSFYKTALELINTGTGCIDSTVRSEAFLGWVNLFLMGGGRKLRNIVIQRNDFNCPTGSPSPGEAASGWLSNTIDLCTFEAYVRASDVKFDQYLPIATGGRLKFSALELQALKMRDGIVRSDFGTRIREIGGLDTELLAELDTLSQQLPGPSDIIRFMVRDADDEAGIVQKFKLDQGFTEKYQSQLQQWGKNQGLPEKVAKYHWRAHWTIPSPTQLYNIWHRLRGRKDVNANDLMGDIKTALEQQDILPYWIDRLLEVAYSPLTRTDAKRAFNEGSLDQDGLRAAFVENGYSDADADSLVKFAKIERKDHMRHLPPIKLYADSIIGDQDLERLVRDLGYEGDSLDDMKKVANQEYENVTSRRRVESVIAAYKTYKIQYDDAVSLLTGYLRDVAPATKLLDEVRSLRNSKSKHIAMGQLCTMLDQGVITGSQYVQEAKDGGWSNEDATRYLNVCTNKIETRKAKAQLAEDAKLERLQKAQQKAQQQAEKAQSGEENALAKQLSALEKGRQARNVKLENAASKLAALGAIDAAQATGEVLGAWRSLWQTGGLSQDEAASLVLYVANNWGKYGDSDYGTVVGKLAGSAARDAWTLYPLGFVPEQP
jgi:hypothetical protein